MSTTTSGKTFIEEGDTESVSSDALKSHKPTYGEKMKLEAQVALEKKTRLNQSDIKELDTYYQCYLCPYVNKHSNDIGGHHFKAAVAHPGHVWDISLALMFKRTEGGDHKEYKRKLPIVKGPRQWVLVDRTGSNDKNDVIKSEESDESDEDEYGGEGPESDIKPPASAKAFSLSSVSLDRPSIILQSKSAPKSYGGMGLEQFENLDLPNPQPSKKSKRASGASVSGNNEAGPPQASGQIVQSAGAEFERRVDRLYETPEGRALYQRGKLDEARDEIRRGKEAAAEQKGRKSRDAVEVI